MQEKRTTFIPASKRLFTTSTFPAAAAWRRGSVWRASLFMLLVFHSDGMVGCGLPSTWVPPTGQFAQKAQNPVPKGRSRVTPTPNGSYVTGLRAA